MFHLTLTLLLLSYCCPNVFTDTTQASVTTLSSPQKLFCASCSYGISFSDLRNKSNWQSPLLHCQNQTVTPSTFLATACHTLLRVDYARQYLTIYYNASHLSLKKLPDDKQRIIFETIMSTKGTRAQFKAFYECSFKDNCHLTSDHFVQLQNALGFIDNKYKTLIQELKQFYKNPKNEVYTYFHSDTLTFTLNSYCGDMDQFDKASTKTITPKCLKATDKLKFKSMEHHDGVKITAFTCKSRRNTYCGSETKMAKFLYNVTADDYVRKFFKIE